MKLGYLCSVLVAVVPCLAHPLRGAALLDEKQGVELGAARIIHTIRGAEQALAKDLRGHPQLLLTEERLLHQASQLALKAGKARAKQVNAKNKLHSIEASLMQSEGAAGAGTGFDGIARQEAKLLRGGRGILHEVHVLKEDFQKALGKKDPEVTAKLEQLMDHVDVAQKSILKSEAQATAHASQLAADIRNEKKEKAATKSAPAFAQAGTSSSTGTSDPVRRAELTKKALMRLKEAKSEVAEAFGTDDGSAQKVEAMVDQLEGSLQGLQEGSEDDVKVNIKDQEAEMIADIEGSATQKRVAQKASLAQAQTHSMTSARRFRLQAHRLQKVEQKTRQLAMEDRRISKETRVARRAVDKELGNTAIGAEVSALLRKAATEASRAAISGRRLAAVQHRQVHGMAHMATIADH